MNTAILIPARLNSSRLPKKIIADIGGKPLVWWVWKKACEVHGINDVYIAVDEQEVFDICIAFGAKVVMTSQHHQSGTDRIGEAIEKIESSYDYIINIQGDEPLIDTKTVGDFAKFLVNNQLQIGTIATSITTEEDLFDFNVVKVIKDQKNKAIYFSRNAIPAFRDKPYKEWLNNFPYCRHIGVYGFKTEVLKKIINLSPSSLEVAESLEQLRWIENGYQIGIMEVNYASKGVDTQEDLDKIREILA